MAWTGFSSADLNRLKDKDERTLNRQNAKDKQKQNVPRSKEQQRPGRGKLGASLTPPKIREAAPSSSENSPQSIAPPVVEFIGGGGDNADNKSKEVTTNNKKVPSAGIDTLRENGTNLVTPNKIITEKDKITDFQNKQKQIEELNKRKRATLSIQIKERQKAAREESIKMSALQKQLSNMDEQLTVDVSIIRDEIEAATYTYNDARRRYETAEKELIASKLDLYSKTELKEKLTEKLYSVINRNEQKKAMRLSQLMMKLNQSGNDDPESQQTTLVLDMPPLIPAVESAIITPRPSQMKQVSSLIKADTKPPESTEDKNPAKKEISNELDKNKSSEKVEELNRDKKETKDKDNENNKDIKDNKDNKDDSTPSNDDNDNKNGSASLNDNKGNVDKNKMETENSNNTSKDISDA